MNAQNTNHRPARETNNRNNEWVAQAQNVADRLERLKAKVDRLLAK